VLLHVFDIYLAGGNPKAYDDLLKFYASTPGRIMEVLLGAALFYHALNGIRILLMDFWPRLTLPQADLVRELGHLPRRGPARRLHHHATGPGPVEERRDGTVFALRPAPPAERRLRAGAWYYMRLSGVALFVLALTHFSVQHFLSDPSRTRPPAGSSPGLEQPSARLRLADAGDSSCPTPSWACGP
jgi:succinate dehydrogenase/fumarate reductase cytochrome b subunit